LNSATNAAKDVGEGEENRGYFTWEYSEKKKEIHLGKKLCEITEGALAAELETSPKKIVPERVLNHQTEMKKKTGRPGEGCSAARWGSGKKGLNWA